MFFSYLHFDLIMLYLGFTQQNFCTVKSFLEIPLNTQSKRERGCQQQQQQEGNLKQFLVTEEVSNIYLTWLDMNDDKWFANAKKGIIGYRHSLQTPKN